MAKVTTINTKTDEVVERTFSKFEEAQSYYQEIKDDGNIHALQH